MSTEEYNALNSKLDRLEKLTLIGAKNVLTIDEVAVITGLAKGYVYRLTSSKRIPHYKLNGRNLYFKKDEIEAWLMQDRISTNDEIESEATTYTAINRR
ncbi:MAG: helix-turn-helix domain-containing protein [Bacteroidales bacterium]